MRKILTRAAVVVALVALAVLLTPFRAAAQGAAQPKVKVEPAPAVVVNNTVCNGPTCRAHPILDAIDDVGTAIVYRIEHRPRLFHFRCRFHGRFRCH